LHELLIFICLSIVFECGLGILYGIGIGYDPMLVFPAAIILNFLAIFAAVFIVDSLLQWKKGLRNWIERRLARGQKLIDKYGCVGIVLGILVLSPIQLAVVGRLVGMKSSRLYPALLGAIFLVATAFLGLALGIFKVLLP